MTASLSAKNLSPVNLVTETASGMQVTVGCGTICMFHVGGAALGSTHRELVSACLPNQQRSDALVN